MATTSTGYPYPVGTDRVMDGDDAIKALASKVPQVQGGVVSVAAPSNNSTGSAAVVFPVPFPPGTVPVVVACLQVTSPATGTTTFRVVSVSGITNTGFTAYCWSYSTTAVPVAWIAYIPGQA